MQNQKKKKNSIEIRQRYLKCAVSETRIPSEKVVWTKLHTYAGFLQKTKNKRGGNTGPPNVGKHTQILINASGFSKMK